MGLDGSQHPIDGHHSAQGVFGDRHHLLQLYIEEEHPLIKQQYQQMQTQYSNTAYWTVRTVRTHIGMVCRHYSSGSLGPED